MEHSTPVPPAPPDPGPAPTAPAGWWRRPVADVVDLVVLAVAAGLVGGALAAIVHASTRDQLFGGLVAAFFGLVAAAGAALVGWVLLALRVRAGRPTPGERCSGAARTGRVLPLLGRHLAVLVALFAAAGALASLAEPSPTGEMAAAGGAAVAAGALVLAYGWGRPSRRVGIVVAAFVVCGVAAGLVPSVPAS